MKPMLAKTCTMTSLRENRYCGRCAKVCPVGATVVDVKSKSHQHLTERCIGCGLRSGPRQDDVY